MDLLETDAPPAFPLSDLQQAYWLGEYGDFELAGPAYFIDDYRAAELDVARLNTALNRLIQRQHGLRTVFRRDGAPVILEHVPEYAVKFRDLEALSGPEVDEVLQQHRETLHAHLPGLDQWPLLELFVFALPGGGFHVRLLGRLITLDGYSGYVFADELRALYEGRELPPLEYGYRDYRIAMDKLQGTPAHTKAVEYWKNRLGSLPGAPELPLARKTPPPGQTRLRRRVFRMPAEQWRQFKRVIQRKRVTPSAALCAAFAELLANWSKSGHFTLNIMYGQRYPLHRDVNSLIGNFSSTVLLEVDTLAPGSFADRAQQLLTRMARDLDHWQVSGISTLRELNRRTGNKRGAAMPVVFSSVLGSGAKNDDKVFMERMGWRRLDGAIHTPQVTFDHQVFESNAELLVNWDTVDELFPEGMVDAMFDAYVSLLQRLADGGPEWEQESLSLIPARQLQVREQRNATFAPRGEDTLHSAFLQWARQHPQNIALITSERTLTYGELAREAGRVASQLMARGHAPGELVGLLAEKGWKQVVGMLGILCAGGAYVPLPPEAPAERKRQIIQRARLHRVLQARDTGMEGAPPPRVEMLSLEEALDADEREPFVPSAGRVDDLAYVLYTSGTTGMPKGVMISHRGAINTVLDINRRFEVGSGDRVLAVSEYGFDLSVYDVFGLLSVGGAVVIPDAHGARDPQHLHDWVIRQGVTIWNTVPAYLSLLLEYVAGLPHRTPLPLRLVLLSGDWIPLSLPDELRSIAPDARCISLGGATEASIWSNVYPIPARLPEDWVSIPYGYPLENQQFHVYDRASRDRPDWVPGELYISGTGLAEGYLHDEAATRHAFLQHPRTGQRLYRTGDWGRYWPDGCLEFLGREDSQVKINGFRVELTEIESCLLQHPDVQSAAVIAHGERRDAKSLAAFFVSSRQDPALELELTTLSREHLAPYMVPRVFLRLEALPLSTNGKVDRRVLQQTLKSLPARENSAPPRTAAQERLASLWEELLGTRAFGVTDDFFELGGTSLTAVRLMNRIDQSFRLRLPVATLYQHPTIEALARLLDEQHEQMTPSCLVRLAGEDSARPLFLVHPVGGDVLCYRPLVRGLAGQFLLQGLRAPGLHQNERPLRSIEQMAKHYLSLIHGAAAREPLRIAGWSLGGVIAYEMARQRAEAGLRSEVLMIDPWLRRAGMSRSGVDARTLVRAFFHDLAGGQLEFSPSSGESSTPGELLRSGWEHVKSRLGLGAAFSLEELQTVFNVYEANNDALLAYEPRGGEGFTVSVLEAEDSVRHPNHPYLRPLKQVLGDGVRAPISRWDTLAGDHYSLLREEGVGPVRAWLLDVLGTA